MLDTDTSPGAIRGLPREQLLKRRLPIRKLNAIVTFYLYPPGVRFRIKQHCVNKDFNKATLMGCLSLFVSLCCLALSCSNMWWAECLKCFAT